MSDLQQSQSKHEAESRALWNHRPLRRPVVDITVIGPPPVRSSRPFDAVVWYGMWDDRPQRDGTCSYSNRLARRGGGRVSVEPASTSPLPQPIVLDDVPVLAVPTDCADPRLPARSGGGWSSGERASVTAASPSPRHRSPSPLGSTAITKFRLERGHMEVHLVPHSMIVPVPPGQRVLPEMPTRLATNRANFG
jgi:hypothetical protein